MKIRDVSGRSAERISEKVKGDNVDGPISGHVNFKDVLNESQTANVEERIANLLQDMEEQGQKLARSLNIKDLLIFKKKVRDFIDEAVHGMLRFSKESVMDRRGRHKIYALVKKINHELEGLTDQMMEEQKDRIKILEKIDSVKGLLVDLYT